MKSFPQLTLSLALALGLTTVSFGDTFNFSYTFGDGLVVTGTLDGTQRGQFVEGVSNVSVFFAGSPMTAFAGGAPMVGTVFTSKYDGEGLYSNGAVVSFDGLQNNFAFSNGSFTDGEFNYDSYFSIQNGFVDYSDLAVAFAPPILSVEFPTSASWSLTASSSGGPTAVPDGGATFAFLGIAMTGLLVLRRRR